MTPSSEIEEGTGLQGNLDGCDGLVIHGWAYSPRRPAVPATLEIAVDGMVIDRVLADRFRPDLEASGVGDGRYGFVVVLPAAVADGRRHVATVRDTESGVEIPGSPVLLSLPKQFANDMRARVADRLDLQHQLAVTEQILLSAGRRHANQGVSAMDPAIEATYRGIISAWPTDIRDEEQ